MDLHQHFCIYNLAFPTFSFYHDFVNLAHLYTNVAVLFKLKRSVAEWKDLPVTKQIGIKERKKTNGKRQKLN